MNFYVFFFVFCSFELFEFFDVKNQFKVVAPLISLNIDDLTNYEESQRLTTEETILNERHGSNESTQNLNYDRFFSFIIGPSVDDNKRLLLF